MADNLMRYSLEVGWGGGQQGTKMHPRDEGEWVKYEDAAELAEENKRLRDEREILENLAHSQARNSGEESDRADKAEARLTAALEVLKAVEWRLLIGDYGYPTCPKCKQAKKTGHASDCTLDAVLNKKEGS